MDCRTFGSTIAVDSEFDYFTFISRLMEVKDLGSCNEGSLPMLANILEVLVLALVPGMPDNMAEFMP